MKLYEIDQNIVHILSQVDDETGEIPDAALSALESLEMGRKAKVAAIIAVIRNAESAADAINAEISRLQRMAAAPTNTVTRLKEYLLRSMQALGETKIDCGPIGKPRIQKNSQPSVKYAGDVSDLPERFQRVTVDVNKSAIADAFKAGDELPKGVTVETGVHLRLG